MSVGMFAEQNARMTATLLEKQRELNVARERNRELEAANDDFVNESAAEAAKVQGELTKLRREHAQLQVRTRELEAQAANYKRHADAFVYGESEEGSVMIDQLESRNRELEADAVAVRTTLHLNADAPPDEVRESIDSMAVKIPYGWCSECEVECRLVDIDGCCLSCGIEPIEPTSGHVARVAELEAERDAALGRCEGLQSALNEKACISPGNAFRSTVCRLARELGWDSDGELTETLKIKQYAPNALDFIRAATQPRPMEVAPTAGHMLLVFRVYAPMLDELSCDPDGWLPDTGWTPLPEGREPGEQGGETDGE